MPRKKVTTSDVTVPKVIKPNSLYSITHIVPTVQYGNVQYKIEGNTLEGVADGIREMIAAYPPHDPLMEKELAKGNQEIQVEVVKKQKVTEQNLIDELPIE